MRIVFGAAILLTVVAVVVWPRPRPIDTSAFFRPDDPTPLAFPIIRTGMNFDELQRDPKGGEMFEIEFEWHPTSGPFDDIRAELPENSGLVCAQYHLRPPYLGAFRLSLEAAFADYDRDTGPHPGEEVWPDVQGYRLTLNGGRYSVYPLNPEDIAVFRFYRGIKRSSFAGLAVLLLAAVARRLRRGCSVRSGSIHRGDGP